MEGWKYSTYVVELLLLGETGSETVGPNFGILSGSANLLLMQDEEVVDPVVVYHRV